MKKRLALSAATLFLATPQHVPAQPSHLYKTTSQIIQILKQKIPTLHNRDAGLIESLADAKMITLPQKTSIGADLTKLPAPPDEAFKTTLNQLINDNAPVTESLTIDIFKQKKVGGVYDIEGSGDCQNWLIFSYDQTASHQMPTPDIFQPGVCSKQAIQNGIITAGASSGLFTINHQLVAFSLQFQSAPADESLTLQIWTGSDWAAPATLNFVQNGRP
jgi:hypothetical protein